jgi:uncharacterized delta-60 repeat protein
VTYKFFTLIVILILLISHVFAADGDPDTTLNTTGRLTTDFATGPDTARDVIVLPDGKFLAVGGVGVSGLSRFGLCRYLPNGTLDPDFGIAGQTTLAGNGGGSIGANGFAVQPDGKIVVVGIGRAGGQFDFDFIVARFLPNGAPDTAFGTGGLVQFQMQPGAGAIDDGANDVAIQEDGRIVVVGVTFVSGTAAFAVARLTATGALDNSFDSDGRTTTTFGVGAAEAHDIAILPDGKILVAGDRNLARYLPTGELDSPFGGGTGRSLIADTNAIREMAVMPDGRIVVVGTATNVTPQAMRVARLDPLGFLDATFNGNGRASVSISLTEADQGTAIEIQPDGKIVIGGSVGFVPDFGLARFNANGILDSSFGTNGRVRTSFTDVGDRLNGLALLRDGRILAAGGVNGTSGSTDFGIARYQGSSVRGMLPRAFDFDGDARDDFFVYRPSEGNWYVRTSTLASFQQKWGLAGDELVPADYDSDGRTDIAVWRPSEGNFYILNSSNGTFRVLNLGLAGDVSVHGDWDGDGRADPAVYREASGGGQSVFYYRGSLNNPADNITFVPWGTTGDKAVRGDFDGDGWMDPAIFRLSTGTWVFRRSSNQQVVFEQWGVASDRLVPADYDGDRRTDLAVFRDGTWFIRPSGGGALRFIQFATATDVPVPGDYDGDGRADPTIYRGGQWWSLQGFAGISVAQWGLPTDSVFQ